MLECDYNLHKSNSTYFTDLDMSRSNLALVLFGKQFNPFPGPRHMVIILGGAQCVWRREIKPYEPYELWTRILAWDEKWIYIVTHFVERDHYVHKEYILQPRRTLRKKKCKPKQPMKALFASAVARYVVKNNKRTVSPDELLRLCGLLPPEDSQNFQEIESKRQKWLSIAQLREGWDAVHGLFDGDESAALGHFSDFMWC